MMSSVLLSRSLRGLDSSIWSRFGLECCRSLREIECFILFMYISYLIYRQIIYGYAIFDLDFNAACKTSGKRLKIHPLHSILNKCIN